MPWKLRLKPQNERITDSPKGEPGVAKWRHEISKDPSKNALPKAKDAERKYISKMKSFYHQFAVLPTPF